MQLLVNVLLNIVPRALSWKAESSVHLCSDVSIVIDEIGFKVTGIVRQVDAV